MTGWKPKEEKWDPSWPYNFGWGVSSEGQVHVWRTKDKDDHRDVLEKEWERPAHTGTGDTLGRAQYIPAEMHMDGSIVAPPEIQVQVFYGHKLPDRLVDWLEDRFPGVVVREAHRREVKPEKKEAKRIEWHEKDDKIEIDAQHSVSPKELSEYKKDLAKRFPDQEIVAPEYGDDPRHDAFDPDYMDEDIRLKREASARWARTNIVPELSVGYDLRDPAVEREYLARLKELGVDVKAPVSDSQALPEDPGGKIPGRVARGLKRLLSRR